MWMCGGHWSCDGYLTGKPVRGPGSIKSTIIVSLKCIMKTRKPFSFFAPITCMLLLLMNTTEAQNYWVGGVTGAESDWNHPRNWSKQQVPDWTDQVVIVPDVTTESGHFPVVAEQTTAIPCLQIEGGATVTILGTGRLTIDGTTTYNHGLINTGRLINAGEIVIQDTALAPVAFATEHIHNTGVIVLGNPNLQLPAVAGN